MSKSTICSFFKILSNEIRIDIIRELEAHDRTVMELVQKIKHNQTTISHNLRYLSEYGFVIARKEGRYRIYKLNEKIVKPLLEIVDKHLKEMENEIEASLGID